MGVQPVGICGTRARLQGTKAFADFAIFDAALQGKMEGLMLSGMTATSRLTGRVVVHEPPAGR